MNKEWYKSKTFVAAIAYVILAGLDIAGLDGELIDVAQLIAFVGMFLGIRDAQK